jgi:hypothetical protein
LRAPQAKPDGALGLPFGPGGRPASFRRPTGGFTTKPPKHKGQIHREVREVREERFHHKDTADTKGERCKLQAQRSRRKEGCGLWIIHPCFRPSVVRVVPGYGGKNLTTEITEDTEGKG